jgi:hypothetical protein
MNTLSPAAVSRAVPLAVFFLAVVLAFGCGPRYLTVERGPQAYYQTGYPIHDTSRELERVFRSVKRIGFSGDYLTYVFAEDSGVTDADLVSQEVYSLAVDTLSDSLSKAGTAVVVSRTDRRLTLVTNHHVVYYPALRVQYYDEVATAASSSPQRRVASVSILQHSAGRLLEYPDLGPFEVLARDEANDLALIGVQLRPWSDPASFPPMPIAAGDPNQLGWGSFLYILGYPRGYRMVSRAITSDPNRDRRGSFLADGLWNEGFSGGAVLAVRGDTGQLEWVGVARASAGDREIRLQPGFDRTALDELDLRRLYEGPVYVEEILRIQYGITLSVPLTLVRDFFSEHRATLSRRGFGLPRY